MGEPIAALAFVLSTLYWRLGSADPFGALRPRPLLDHDLCEDVVPGRAGNSSGPSVTRGDEVGRDLDGVGLLVGVAASRYVKPPMAWLLGGGTLEVKGG